MLNDLLQFAADKGLGEKYEVVKHATHVLCLAGANSPPRLLPYGKDISVPVAKRSGTSAKPYPLQDNVEYVLGQPRTDRAKKLCTAFWQFHRDTLPQKFQSSLKRTQERIDEVAVGSEKVQMIVLADEHGTPLALEPSIMALYAPKTGAQTAIDVITGEPCVPVGTLSLIKGVIGTDGPNKAKPFPLASVNTGTMGCLAYGSDRQAGHFSVSAKTDLSIAQALNYLLVPSNGHYVVVTPIVQAVLLASDPAINIAAVSTMLGRPGATQEEREQAWAYLDSWEPSGTVKFFVLRGTQGRIAKMAEETYTAQGVKDGLSLFSDCLRSRSSVMWDLAKLAELTRVHAGPNLFWSFLRCLLSGARLPAEFSRSLLHMGPVKLRKLGSRYMRDDQATQLFLDWILLFELSHNKQLRKKSMNTDANAKPEWQDFLYQGELRPAYFLGALCAHVEYGAAIAQLGNGMTGANLHSSAYASPQRFIEEALRSARIYAQKAQNPWILNETSRIISQSAERLETTDSLVRPMSLADRPQFVLGWAARREFQKARRLYNNRKKNEAKTDATTTDK